MVVFILRTYEGFSKRCGFGERIHWFRVDGKPISAKHAVSKMFGFDWMRPPLLFLIITSESVYSATRPVTDQSSIISITGYMLYINTDQAIGNQEQGK